MVMLFYGKAQYLWLSYGFLCFPLLYGYQYTTQQQSAYNVQGGYGAQYNITGYLEARLGVDWQHRNQRGVLPLAEW